MTETLSRLSCTSDEIPNITEGQTCPACSYTRTPLPSWTQSTARPIFTLKGKTYRMLSQGSTNSGRQHPHFIDYIIAEEFGSESWALPDAPATGQEILSSLRELRQLPRFTAAEIVDVIVA
ncbi:MAG: hypothetical protein ACHREM_04635 [Polyangiales bacterium]